MLMANVLVQLNVIRLDLEAEQRELEHINSLIEILTDKRQHIIGNISYLEGKIEELEDELDA